MRTKTYYVEGRDYEVECKEMLASELLFWKDNPRIYESIRREFDDSPTQEDILEFMLNKDSTKKLSKIIKRAGGVNEALIVRKDENSQFIVYEGNTRLAVVKNLFLNNDLTSENIPVEILPEDISDDVISSIVGEAHLTGKADWSAFETNSYLERRYSYMINQEGMNHGEAIDKLAKQFNISPNQIKKAISTISFMEKNNLKTDPGIKKFSYWQQYTSGNKIKRLAKLFNDKEKFSEIRTTKRENPFDKFYIDLVFEEGCPKAVDIRDIFNRLETAYDKEQKEPLEQLIRGEISPLDADRMIDETKLSILNFFDQISKRLNGVDANLISKELETNNEMRTKLRYIHNFLSTLLNIQEAIAGAETVPSIYDDEADGNEKIIRMQESALVEKLDELAKSEHLPAKDFNKAIFRLMINDLVKANKINNKNYEDWINMNNFPEELKDIVHNYRDNLD